MFWLVCQYLTENYTTSLMKKISFVNIAKENEKYLQKYFKNNQKSFAFFCFMRYNVIINLKIRGDVRI